ncbi:MAG: hypothetical protein H0U57_02715 [Tatlockia sp.]|nr:hypothetical protein [Tatlockia sp.]
MIHSFLYQDGSINKDALENFLRNNDINMTYESPEGLESQTLLLETVSSPELTTQVKLNLISYLLQKGAEINNRELKKGLLGIALATNNLELADFLLKKGADTKDKDLQDIAAHTKNEATILWVSRNTIPESKNDEFNQFFEKVKTQIAINNASGDEILNKLKKERIMRKFEKLGNIGVEEMTLILAAKMSKKETKNSIFICLSHDLNLLQKEIKNLLENETKEKIIKFQIIYYQGVHACCGEFKIDKTGEFPVVNYLHFDSLPEETPFHEVVTLDFVKEISPLANIKVYDSEVKLQKGRGCTYMSIETARMLSTPTDQDYAVNLMEYMKQKGKRKNAPKTIFKSYSDKINYTTSTMLPARFLRSLQYTKDDENKENESIVNQSLESFIFKTNEKKTIVNKKGETAEDSIKKDLLVNKGLMTSFNLRTERKMKQYKANVNDFISKRNILDPEFANQVNQYRAAGLKLFCEERMVPQKEKTFKL